MRLMDAREHIGERRSRKFTAYFEVPMGTPLGRIPVRQYILGYIGMKEKEGWRLERVGKVQKDPFIKFTGKGGMDVYVFNVLLSRPLQQLKLDVPDSIIPRLLAKRPDIRLV